MLFKQIISLLESIHKRGIMIGPLTPEILKLGTKQDKTTVFISSFQNSCSIGEQIEYEEKPELHMFSSINYDK